MEFPHKKMNGNSLNSSKKSEYGHGLDYTGDGILVLFFQNQIGEKKNANTKESNQRYE